MESRPTAQVSRESLMKQYFGLPRKLVFEKLSAYRCGWYKDGWRMLKYALGTMIALTQVMKTVYIFPLKSFFGLFVARVWWNALFFFTKMWTSSSQKSCKTLPNSLHKDHTKIFNSFACRKSIMTQKYHFSKLKYNNGERTRININ